MKRKINFIAILAVLATVGLTSCNQVKDKLFSAFITPSADVNFTIDVITNTSTLGDIGSMNTNLNLDSIIKAQTDNTFSLNSITSINIEECKLTILNPDATNNIANFEEVKVSLKTNTNSTPVQLCTGLNPDVYGDIWLLPVDKTVNLKDYLNGTQLTYIIGAKARRVTTKKLDCKMTIKFKVN